MSIEHGALHAGICQGSNDQLHHLYSTLRPAILAWIYASGVIAWRGQENDIADDILQETVVRTYAYMQQVENGFNQPIISLISFSRTVARNHFKDLRRKDLRLIRPSLYEESDRESLDITYDDIDPAETVLETITHEAQMMTAVHIIANLPGKQRMALLIDLANHAEEDEKEGKLQTAFLKVGIRLHDYRRLLPGNATERGRHAALLSIARKRLRQRFSTRETSHSTWSSRTAGTYKIGELL